MPNKQTEQSVKKMPFCLKCANRLIQPDMLDGSEELVGCRLLGQKKWSKGWREDDTGICYQHNCPII